MGLETSFHLRFRLSLFLCSRASDYGLMKIDDKGRVLYFNEKPRGADLKSMVRIDFEAQQPCVLQFKLSFSVIEYVF